MKLLVGKREMWNSENLFRPCRHYAWVIWYQRSFGEEDWCVISKADYRMKVLFFSFFFFSSSHFIFRTKLWICIVTVFFLPRKKLRRKIILYVQLIQVDIFYLLRLLFIWIKSSLVSFLEHFIKMSLVDVLCAWNPYSELKVGSPSFPPNHTIASS